MTAVVKNLDHIEKTEGMGRVERKRKSEETRREIVDFKTRKERARHRPSDESI